MIEACAGWAGRGQPRFFTAQEVDPMAPMKIPSRKPDLVPADRFASHSLSHVARCLHVSRRTIRRMLARGELPFVQIDGTIRVPRSALDIHSQPLP
jgi:excisionase family DNA binding protein